MDAIKNVAMGFVCLLLALAGGCQGGSGAPDGSAALSIPLIQPGTGDSVYRLRDASFRVIGPGGVDLVLDAGDDDPSLTVFLAPGLHTIELLDGWTLERSEDGVLFAPVTDAVLASENPDGIRLFANRTQSASFQFIQRRQTSEVVISFGVVEEPREFAGAIRWISADPAYAAYVGQVTDFAIFYAPLAQTLTTLEDGTRVRTIDSVVNVFEVYNDGPGLLGPLAAGLNGGVLSFEVAVAPDQVGVPDPTGRFSGVYFGAVELNFIPSGQVFGITLDGSGFPEDVAYFVFTQNIELVENGVVVLSGRSTGSIRHFLD